MHSESVASNMSPQMQGSVLGYDGVMGRAIDAELTAPCLWLKG